MKVGRPSSSLLDETGNVCCFFDHWVGRAPDRPALLVPRQRRGGAVLHESVTFGELDRGGSRVAGALAERGIGRGDRVLLMVPMSAQLYEVMLGVLKLGACAVFVDPWASLDVLSSMVERTKPDAFVGAPKAHLLRALSPAVRRIPLKLSAGAPALLGGRLEALQRGRPARRPALVIERDEGALLTFTTGSTGRPRGALRSHAFLDAQGAALARHLPREDGDVDMTSLPVFVLSNLAAGVPSVLPLVDFRRVADVDGGVIVEQIRATGVRTLGGSPAFLAAVVRWALAHDVTLPGVRGVATGGAPVEPELLEGLRQVCPDARGNIRVLYGSTEVEPISQIEADEVLRDRAPAAGTCVGRPVPELAVRVARVTDAGAVPTALDVEPGTPGELLVCGAHVQRDYWQDEAATRATKLEGDDGRLWHRTGDVGYLDERGRLWLLGRARDVLSTDEGALYPWPVEAIARRVEGVDAAALLSLDGQAAVAFELALGAARAPVAAEIVRACREAGFAVARAVVVDRIPVDPRHNSKVDHRRLRAALEGAA
jgi:acyl-CoA synthetase (AMP-forming)/AMP-acid ligase II